jgi:hypothetical protein
VLSILPVRKDWLILNLAEKSQLKTAVVFSPSYASLNLNYPLLHIFIDLEEEQRFFI